MARRITLPRLTQRQRMARWQRERRQQVVYLTAFTTVLLVALGLVGWAAASQYYDGNLKPAAIVAGAAVPMRDYNKRFTFDKDRFYEEAGVPAGSENDPRVQSQLIQIRSSSLEMVVLGDTLLLVARDQGEVPSADDVQAQIDKEFGELHVRHILVAPNKDEKDTAKADADAKAKADGIAKQLKADPANDGLWKDLAAKSSDDPGSKDQGGDLGWVNSSSGFITEFTDAMYALSDGQVSDPVKTQFGYHVIQRIATRTYAQTPLYQRLRKSGFTLDDLRGVARTDLLRDRYEQKAKNAEIASPQPQLHLADIQVSMPSPASDPQGYTAAIKKINDVTDGLAAGKDFAELAKADSDDTETKDKGGDMGWVTRGELPSKEIADDLFARKAGERSDQHALANGNVVIYKILERDEARAVTDDQKSKIKDQAFSLWLKEQEDRYHVDRLLPGMEF